MAKRRQRGADEIMMIPFLDILCSLIGVLVLIIVVLVVAQTQKINGRTPEEIARAQEHVRLLKVKAEQMAKSEGVSEKVAALDALKEEAHGKELELVKLRQLLNVSQTSREEQSARHQKLMKELDDLLIEIRGFNSQEAPLKKTMADLLAEIKKRQPPENKGIPVQVRPGGSGMAKGSKVFFIDATAEKLTFFWDENTKGTVSSAPEVIAVDSMFNQYLKAVQSVPQSKIIFLLRDNGMGAFNNGAGWAQATHGFKPEQIGKLPIPGYGPLDLGMFKEFLGAIPAPAPVPVATPPKP